MSHAQRGIIVIEMKNLLIIAGKSEHAGGRYYYMMKYCTKIYRTTLLHYLTQKTGKKEGIVIGSMDSVLEAQEPIRTIGVKILFEDLSLKSKSIDRILYPVFFTFLQPFYAALRAYRHLSGFDVCIAAGLWAGIIGSTLKRLGRTNFLVYEDLDIFPYFWNNKLFRMILYSIEKYVVKRANLVVSVSNSLAELRRAQGAKRLIVIPNGVDYEFFKKGQNKKTHIPTLVYVGGLVQYQGIDLPLKCLPEIREALGDIRYLVLGEGVFENNLRQMIRELKLQNIVFLLGRQKHEIIPDFFSESDIAIATSKPSTLNRYSAPYKIPEYMAAGLPVITTKMGERERITDGLDGLVSINFSAEEFKRAVIELLSNDRRYKELSENAAKTAKSLDWSRLFEIEFTEIEKELRRRQRALVANA